MYTLKLDWEAVRVCCVLDALNERGSGLTGREKGIAEAQLGLYRGAEHGATIKLNWSERMIEHVMEALRRTLDDTRYSKAGLEVYREEVRAACEEIRDYRAAVQAVKDME